MFSVRNSMVRIGLSTLFLVLGSGIVNAAEKSKSPAVVELFTSQGCYSCPPAEAYLGKLSKRSDVIALEFHVDYWDNLVYGSAGKWKDPFSSPKYTERQRQYNQLIRRTRGVYTPQMIIGGMIETVGSSEYKVERAIKKVASPLSVRIKGKASGSLDIQIAGQNSDSASVWLIRFYQSVETKVRSGENKGKTLISHNIVNGVKQIGEWRGAPLSLTVNGPDAASKNGCAIIVQKEPAGQILGATYCPNVPSS